MMFVPINTIAFRFIPRDQTNNASGLFALREHLAKPNDSVILPDIISKEPLGPAVRQDDVQWFNIVKWVNFAMLNAEELGVSSKTSRPRAISEA